MTPEQKKLIEELRELDKERPHLMPQQSSKMMQLIETLLQENERISELLERLQVDFGLGYQVEPFGLTFSKAQCEEICKKIDALQDAEKLTKGHP